MLLLTGLSPYLHLLFNSDPEIAVFGAVSMESFFDYVSRSYYVDNYEGAGVVDKLNFFLWLIPESGLQFGVIGFVTNYGVYAVLTTSTSYFDDYRVLALLAGVACGSIFNFTAASLFVYSEKRH